MYKIIMTIGVLVALSSYLSKNNPTLHSKIENGTIKVFDGFKEVFDYIEKELN